MQIFRHCSINIHAMCSYDYGIFVLTYYEVYLHVAISFDCGVILILVRYVCDTDYNQELIFRNRDSLMMSLVTTIVFFCIV